MLNRKRSIFRVFVFSLLGVIAASAMLACAPAPEEKTPTTSEPQAPVQTISKISWRANSIVGPPGYPDLDDKYYGELMRQIVKRTGGRLEIQTHWKNELGFGHREFPKLLKEGLVEITDLPMKLGDLYIPELGYENVPLHLGQPFPKEKNIDIQKARRPIYTEILAEWNGKRLASVFHQSYAEAPAELVSKIPLRSLEEMKGITMRAMAPGEVTFWGTFGIKCVVFSSAEIYMALKTNMVDAAIASRTYYPSSKLHEVAKYLIVYYPSRPSLSAYGWAASTVHWPKLPPDIQSIVVDAYKEYENQLDAISGPDYNPPEAREVEQIIKDNGITIIELPPEDQAKIQALADKQMAEWLVKASERGQRLYKKDMEALGRPERYDMLIELGKTLGK